MHSAASMISFKFHNVSYISFFVDPFALKRNVARSLNSQMVFEYIQERFRTAYKYFACPQSRATGGRQRRKKTVKQDTKLTVGEKKQAGSGEGGESEGKGGKSQRLGRGRHETKDGEEEDESDEEDGSDLSQKREEKTLDASLSDMVLSEGDSPAEGPTRASLSPNGLLDSDEEEGEESCVSGKEAHASPEDLHYIFDRMIFTGGKVIEIL